MDGPRIDAQLFNGSVLYGAAVYPEVLDLQPLKPTLPTWPRLGMNTAGQGGFIWWAAVRARR